MEAAIESDRRPRIRYLLEPFDQPFGGVAVIHRHVEWLAAAGYDAAISLVQAPPCDFYRSAAPVEIHGGRPVPHSGDRYVVPEGLPKLLETVAGAPIRRIMFCQNQYYLPFGPDPGAGIAELGVDLVLGSSQAVLNFFRDVYRVEVPIVPYSIDAASYAPAPKERAILVMPRKRSDLAAFLHSTFRRRHRRLADIPWWVVDRCTTAEAAAAMARAQWFLSLSHRESFGLPPLEAMACATIPAGFAGDGGREYMVPANGFWAEEEDWLGCVDALAHAIEMVDRDATAHAKMLQAGRRTVQHYSPGVARDALLSFWKKELSRDMDGVRKSATVMDNQPPARKSEAPSRLERLRSFIGIRRVR